MNASRIAIVGVVGFLIVNASFLVPASAQQPQSYPFICRGGDNYTIRVSSGDSSANARFIYTFRKTSQGATSGLQPGECAWTGRAVNSAEASTLAFEFPGAVLVMNARRTNGTNGVIFQYGGSSGSLQRIMRAIQGGQEFTVYAYTDRSSTSWSRGHLRVARIGP